MGTSNLKGGYGPEVARRGKSPIKKPRGQDGIFDRGAIGALAQGCQDSARPAVNHNQRRVVPTIATAAGLWLRRYDQFSLSLPL